MWIFVSQFWGSEWELQNITSELWDINAKLQDVKVLKLATPKRKVKIVKSYKVAITIYFLFCSNSGKKSELRDIKCNFWVYIS